MGRVGVCVSCTCRTRSKEAPRTHCYQTDALIDNGAWTLIKSYINSLPSHSWLAPPCTQNIIISISPWSRAGWWAGKKVKSSLSTIFDRFGDVASERVCVCVIFLSFSWAQVCQECVLDIEICGVCFFAEDTIVSEHRTLEGVESLFFAWSVTFKGEEDLFSFL